MKYLIPLIAGAVACTGYTLLRSHAMPDKILGVITLFVGLVTALLATLPLLFKGK